ncbi:hypothetical protein ABZ917_46180 [Nonomuraea wenchangensis]
MGALPKLIADIVPPARTGTANGLNNIARTVGGVVGSRLAAAVIASGSAGRAGAVPDSAFTALFWLAGGVAVAGVAVSPYAVRALRTVTA